jgi:prepilin-type N-terminal cleavage/methylation domain-containing protein
MHSKSHNYQSLNHLASAGFTLVELILVIALLGLVLAIVLPRAGVAATAAAASRQLAGMMHALYLAAPATQKIHRLYLDLDERTYWAMTVESEGERQPRDPALTRRVMLPQEVRFRDAMTASQGKMAVGRAVIQFYPTGRTDRSVVHLFDESQTTLTLVLNPLTGTVQVLEGYKDPNPAQPVPEQYRPFLFPGLTTTRI